VAVLLWNLRIGLGEPLRHDHFEPPSSPLTALTFTLAPLTRVEYESAEHKADEDKADDLQEQAHSGSPCPSTDAVSTR
jgi:hypothetical protein